MENIVVNEVNKFILNRKSSIRESEHLRQQSLFETNIDEADANEVTDNVKTLIKNNQFEKQNPQSFYDSLKKSKHSLMLTDYTPQELSKMEIYKLNGYDIGYALKLHDGEYSEIVAVHNNEPEVKGIGQELMQSAINNGGCYLDHFDGFLSNLYSNMGFVEYNRDKYDPHYDPNGEFKSKYGQSDVIYRAHKNCMNNVK